MGGEVDRTLWAGNLSEKVTEEILYELFLQAGPVDKVKIATERDGRKKSFAFITFSHDASVPYTIQLMDGMLLYGKNLKLQARPGSVHVQPPPQQQQQQQQQYQQPMPQSPYSHQPSSPMDNRYKNNLPGQMPFNPYMINQPMRSQVGPQSTPPHYQRSNTWNGNEQVSQMSVRDSRDRSRDRDRYQNIDRDRSGRRDDYNSGRDSYRGGGSNYRDSGRSEDFESKRQRILQKQNEVLSRYKQDTHQQSQRSSPQHYSHRRGRY